MQIFNEQQVSLFLIAASESKYRALYHLAITTGMRLSELRGLSWSNVDWIKGTIKVNRQIQDMPEVGLVSGAPKTNSGYRTIRLGEKTLSELRGQWERVNADKIFAANHWQENDLIFPSKKGTPFGSMSLYHDFVSLLHKANLPKIRFHDLRHTAASLMLNNGVSPLFVSKILGHSNPSVTISIYAHSTLDMQETAVNVMDEIVTPIPVSISQLHPIAPVAEKSQEKHP